MGSRAANPDRTPQRVRRQTFSLREIPDNSYTKSLFQNTLPVSALQLRLCSRRKRPVAGNYLERNTLQISSKIIGAELFANRKRGGAPTSAPSHAQLPLLRLRLRL